ncbi:MAG: MBL fold metallo-hydrolase [Planctomycetia bacterium]|nr:MBL fold metallo-hydrolase [Planctomycetia bacterium]
MKVIALNSGSNGNCIYVESDGVQILFDAGISGNQAQTRLASYGRDIRDVRALVISHDHRDHSQGLGVYQRKFGLPVHITSGTLTVASKKLKLGSLNDVRYFKQGSVLQFGHLTVETIPTPHDAVDSVAFVVDDGNKRLGILTDLGHATDRLSSVMKSLDAVVIESNHDLAMLTNGSYPESLKRRIGGRHGHLSNADSAELVRRADPRLAVDTHRRVIGERLPIYVASRHEATDVLEV